jgi:hypothetical protein
MSGSGVLPNPRMQPTGWTGPPSARAQHPREDEAERGFGRART